MVRMLQTRADELVEGARIIKSQLRHENRIWMNSMLSRNIGGDVSDLVRDVRFLEVSGRQRDNTWAQPGDREAQRHSQNTMGYQVQCEGTEQGDSSSWCVSLIFVFINI